MQADLASAHRIRHIVAMKVEVRCHACGTVGSFEDRVPFRAECERCAADLHACVHCRFFDKYVENQCREDDAEPVAVKDRRNLCEYFKTIGASGDVDDAARQARAKLDALFGGPSTTRATTAPTPATAGTSSSDVEDAKRKLEELFKKR